MDTKEKLRKKIDKLEPPKTWEDAVKLSILKQQFINYIIQHPYD